VADLHRSLFAAWDQGARTAQSFENVRDPGKRLKLGLLSADFHHQHPVNIFMQPVLARLDKAQLEVTIYHVGMAHDDQTQLARSRADHWVVASGWTPAQLARRIREDGIDVMMDLSGHTSHNRLMVLAQRVAPVQVSFLGYPGSTGVPNIDWLLADPVVVPPAHDALCTERVHRLPNTVFCYAPEVDYPYPSHDAAKAWRPLTFGSFNNVPKLTPHTIALWAQVLARVPGSRLLLKAPSFRDESAIRIFRERFEQQGVDASRIEFRGPVGLTDMMAEYADVDIALDPVPYNGGTTTLQALWMGVPVVVKEGQNFVSRMGASFMRAAGLPEWVATSDEDYVAIAVRMAADRQALLQLKAGLRTRLQAAPAWDIDRYTRDMESALRTMWTDHCTP
jgi:predicted O-linked N-acetylglucosamine transferase (SPINDLY family)